jgi:hypothetical protein
MRPRKSGEEREKKPFSLSAALIKLELRFGEKKIRELERHLGSISLPRVEALYSSAFFAFLAGRVNF